jgi:hypothetical protein
MAKTIQSKLLKQTQDEDLNFPCYLALKEAKQNARDNLNLLSTIYNYMNILCTSLEKIDSEMEKIIFNNKEGRK